MGHRQGCLPAYCCVGMLVVVLSLWLQTCVVSGTVLRVDGSAADGESAGVRVLSDSLLCVGERCKPVHKPDLNNANNNVHYSNNNDDDNVFLKRLLRAQRGSSRRRTPRAKRQTEVVAADGDGTGSSHRVPCTSSEIRKTACLNGGQCYALDMADLRDAFCHCPAKYEGTRCELRSMYLYSKATYYSQLKKGAIIGGVVIGIILIIVSVSVYCRYRKGRRKRNQRSSAASAKPPEADEANDEMLQPATTTDIEIGNANGMNGLGNSSVTRAADDAAYP